LKTISIKTTVILAIFGFYEYILRSFFENDFNI
jgi:hypothetical protein